MAMEIPTSLVEFILLGPTDDRRQLQDSPILGDVWVEFARAPDKTLDLLITPYRTQHAGLVAEAIEVGIGRVDDRTNTADIAYLQGIVVARLSFDEVLRVVVPLTKWWSDRWIKDGKGDDKQKETAPKHQVSEYDLERTTRVIGLILRSAKAWNSKSDDVPAPDLMPLDRYITLTGLMLWAGAHSPPTSQTSPVASSEQVKHILDRATPDEMARLLGEILRTIQADPSREPLVWHISLNRTATAALTKSIPAVKADAAKTLFRVNCSEIAWAVIDSGVDGTHPAFGTDDATGLRIKRCFDFTNFRKIVSLSNSKDGIREANLKALLRREGLLKIPDNPDEALKELANDARRRGPIDWELVEQFVELDPRTKPFSNHGTHVAGIIGANKASAAKAAGKDNDDYADGMCPDIQLYDFRVLGPSIKDTEFAIIAALQFIRHLNDRDNFFTIHGANLSLSIPHDVRNFACGRTPICNECERLVDSGVVVVAAAGNHGYKSFETKEGSYESYAAFSITDPGNADGVVTVGATHRYWPHTYGVSFFSSRGPTGDGRLKPDLVAPGERIRAPLPKNDWGDLDGTSMAAPHVSGAAAMLMARYSELIGQPRRLKRIVCESATDLGRERSFQGHGMLDVLRAFQSI